jgi:hypothetical protein
VPGIFAGTDISALKISPVACHELPAFPIVRVEYAVMDIGCLLRIFFPAALHGEHVQSGSANLMLNRWKVQIASRPPNRGNQLKMAGFVAAYNLEQLISWCVKTDSPLFND